MQKDNIKIEGHRGTWYVIDEKEVQVIDEESRDLISCMGYLLEHEEYGDEAVPLIIDKNLNVLCDAAFNGFDDLEYETESEAYSLGLTPLEERMPKKEITQDPFKDWSEAEKKAYDFLLANPDIGYLDVISVVIKSNGIIGVGLVTLEENIKKFIKTFY